MSVLVFPSLPILSWPATRAVIFKTRKQENISGKEVRIADWSTPRYQWTLTFNGLRQGAANGTTYAEFALLEGFFEKMKGGFDSFLYTDPDDNRVVGQPLAVGDGVHSFWQLQRTFGGATIPVLAPGPGVSTFYDNGVPVLSGHYSVNDWSASPPGQFGFDYAPAAGHVITGDFNYYFPCRFDDDQITFSKFLSYVYELKKLSFTSIK